MPKSQLNQVLNAELGPGWSSKLISFDYEPIAAASIGQVCMLLYLFFFFFFFFGRGALHLKKYEPVHCPHFKFAILRGCVRNV